jgi:ribosome recycling factor
MEIKMSVEQITSDTEIKMKKTIDSVMQDLSKIRTGRASAAMLDGITVDYYGTATPINQMANISIPEPKVIAISPWDRSTTADIEKAILASDLGITPSNDGNLIRLKVPDLTQERRNDMVKLAKKQGEEGKIAIRNVRRDANESFKKLQKSSEISEDELKINTEEIQILTDSFVKKIDEIVKTKEDELLTI